MRADHASLPASLQPAEQACGGSYLQGLRDQVTSLLRSPGLRSLHKTRSLVSRFGEDQLKALAGLEAR